MILEKIKFIVDSPSDIPDEHLREYDIDMLLVPIVVDGKEYLERKSFTIREFYKVLAQSSEIPVTSRIQSFEFRDSYVKAWKDGYNVVISVTINAGGSGTYQSALMGSQMFFDENPEARDAVKIHVVDSKAYTMAYGWPVVEGAQMARQGRTSEEILEFLHDWFDSCEIYLGAYSLEYAKKSGRISAAAAFVGDMLGLRPLISFINGKTKVVDKVRGDKQVIPKLMEIYAKQAASLSGPCFIVQGEVEEYGETLAAVFKERYGRELPVYSAGAAIVINSGPKIIAIVCKGKKRTK